MSDGGIITAFLREAAGNPDRLFAKAYDDSLTFAALEARSAALAAALHDRGLRPGDRAAVMMANSTAAIVVIYALARAGIAWVPVNSGLRGDGLRYILEHCEPRLVIADRDRMAAIRDSQAALPPLVLQNSGIGGDLGPLMSEIRGFEAAPCPPETLFGILYTSGTTGPPKGVLVTHAMMRHAGEAVALITQARDGDVCFMWEPLFHIGGAQLLILPLIRPVRLVLAERFSAGTFWDQVRATGATHIHFLGGILQILLKQPPGPRDRDHGVRLAWGGGCPAEIWRPFEERFGLAIRECYGMSEASSVTTFNDQGVVGSVGRALDWFEVELRDSAGTPVGPGEKGEIVVRAKDPTAIFAGYFKNPEASAKALRDGLLWTGDIGSWDAEGNLAFHGRLTDSMRVRGENVSAWEIERVAAGHPAVEDCAAIGVASEIGEQDIKLFLQPKTGHDLDLDALNVWLAARLARYQLPRFYQPVEAFERTPSQRIMKHRLDPSPTGAWERQFPDMK